MAKLKAKTKKLLKVIAGVLAIALTCGIVSSLASRINTDDTKELNVFDYEIGSLSDTTGKKIKDDKSGLVSKDMYEVKGLTVELEKKADVMYQLNFYDEDKAWVKVETYKQDFDGADEFDTLNAEGIKYAKLEIIPLEDEDEEVSLLEKRGYAKQVKVTVSTEDSEVEEKVESEE